MSEPATAGGKISSIFTPAVAVVFGLVIGMVLILLAGKNPVVAYAAIIEGAFLGPTEIGRTLEKATPLILSGLAVLVAFRAGLFNIGGQGQLLLGACFAGWIGYSVELPGLLHIPLALLVGALVAGILGAAVGALKAYRGAHEVITTIMFNFVAGNFTEFLVSRDGPWRDPPATNPSNIARTPTILDSASLPRVGDLPTGFLVALLAAVLCWWLLERSPLGFEINTVGANRHAATYAGINVKRITILVMVISACLAGLGGAIETQGVVGRFEPGFNAGIGFAGITIALLARSKPLAVIPAALLIGAMQAGSSLMQSKSGVRPDVIDLIQGIILFFVAAPIAVRFVLRNRGSGQEDGLQLSSGWGA